MTLPKEKYDRAAKAMKKELHGKIIEEQIIGKISGGELISKQITGKISGGTVTIKVDWFRPYDSYCLAMVPDFKKLAELSFKQSRPVFEVRNEKSGEPANPERQQEFRTLYRALSGRVLRLTADEQ